MEVKEFLERYGDHSDNICFKDINLYDFVNVNIDDASDINEIADFLDAHGYKQGLEFTRSGGICIKNRFDIIAHYAIRSFAQKGAQLIALTEWGFFKFCWRVQGETREISGRKAFNKLNELLIKDGVDLSKYAIKNGKELKETIDKPLIDVANPAFIDLEIDHCCNIDISSAYPYQLTQLIPETTKVVKMLFNKRKDHPVYKAVLNESQGYMQSKYCCLNGHGYCLANISKFMIEETKKKLLVATKWFRDHKYAVILYCVDGMFISNPYYGDELAEGKHDKYHSVLRDETIDELFELGELTPINKKVLGKFALAHDHCKLRVKSKGSYEFLETMPDGRVEYVSKVRGLKASRRVDMSWGDIYKLDYLPVSYAIENNRIIEYRRED